MMGLLICGTLLVLYCPWIGRKLRYAISHAFMHAMDHLYHHNRELPGRIFIALVYILYVLVFALPTVAAWSFGLPTMYSALLGLSCFSAFVHRLRRNYRKNFSQGGSEH